MLNPDLILIRMPPRRDTRAGPSASFFAGLVLAAALAALLHEARGEAIKSPEIIPSCQLGFEFLEKTTLIEPYKSATVQLLCNLVADHLIDADAVLVRRCGEHSCGETCWSNSALDRFSIAEFDVCGQARPPNRQPR